jgi:hypothetical protein
MDCAMRAEAECQTGNGGDPSLPEVESSSLIPLPSKNEIKLKSSLAKLTSRYMTLQQQLNSLNAQLEHQMRCNEEIKRMIVDDVSVQGPS